MMTPNGLRAGPERVGQQVADLDQQGEPSAQDGGERDADPAADEEPEDPGPLPRPLRGWRSRPW